MLDQVIASLIASTNGAADDVLLEAVKRGSHREGARAAAAILDRKTPAGVFGLLKQFDTLSNEVRLLLVERAGDLYHLLPDAGRSEDPALRSAAIRLIAHGKLGQLCYVLNENLGNSDPAIAAAAVDALVSLSRQVGNDTRRLQSGKLSPKERQGVSRQLMSMRPEIEAAVYRALDLQRPGPDSAARSSGATVGSSGLRKAGDLLRAALLLADSPQSRTVSILSTSRHGGVSPAVKRLQQTPDAEHVDAFLVGATHGQLRAQFPGALAAIDTAPVMDALLRRSYFLKDVRLEQCMRNVVRGAWWSEPQLIKDLSRRGAAENAAIGPWIAAAGVHDVVQDEKLVRVLAAVQGDATARLRLLRIAMNRPQGASLTLLRRFLDDPEETLQRIAAREIVRRRPVDYSSVLLGLMKTAPDSVRRVAGRAIGASAFDGYFERFDKLDVATRGRAGRAVFKLLPDAPMRLSRRLRAGGAEGLLKALLMTSELRVADSVRPAVLALTSHENARVRSKAISVAGEMLPYSASDEVVAKEDAVRKGPGAAGDRMTAPESGAVVGGEMAGGGETAGGLSAVPTPAISEPELSVAAIPALILEKALNDTDARVRANAIEVLEGQGRTEHIPLLAARVRNGSSRERANAIKALHKLKSTAALPGLILMLRDPRPEHRLSALWAARHVGVYRLLEELVRVTREESDPRVKRYAAASVQVVAEKLRQVSPSARRAG